MESGDGRRAEGEEQNQIPELNVYQCGTYQMHSLEEAQEIARHIIERDVRVNSNDELALPKKTSGTAHLVSCLWMPGGASLTGPTI